MIQITPVRDLRVGDHMLCFDAEDRLGPFTPGVVVGVDPTDDHGDYFLVDCVIGEDGDLHWMGELPAEYEVEIVVDRP